MAEFFTLLTTAGSAGLANALLLGQTVDFAEMALGDGNSNPVTPEESMTELTNEVYRAAVNSIAVDPENANQIICEMIVPAATGGWYIREVGIFATDGTMLAVGNFPDTYKPTLAEGSGRDLVVRIILLVDNADPVNLVINPDTVIASQSYVAAQITAHDEAADPHNGKFEPAGAVATHEGLTDPHPQYSQNITAWGSVTGSSGAIAESGSGNWSVSRNNSGRYQLNITDSGNYLVIVQAANATNVNNTDGRVSTSSGIFQNNTADNVAWWDGHGDHYTDRDWSFIAIKL